MQKQKQQLAQQQQQQQALSEPASPAPPPAPRGRRRHFRPAAPASLPPGRSGVPCRNAFGPLGVTDDDDAEPMNRGVAVGDQQEELSAAAAKRLRSEGALAEPARPERLGSG
jgi:hypothetical protein